MTERRVVPRLVWVALALLMVLAQGLGQLHRLAHGPLPGSAPIGTETDAHAAHRHAEDASAEPASHGGWLQALFAADGHAAACVLYDQLTHADGLPSLPVIGLPTAWVDAVPPWHGVWALAAQAAGYLARGPPLRG